MRPHVFGSDLALCGGERCLVSVTQGDSRASRTKQVRTRMGARATSQES